MNKSDPAYRTTVDFLCEKLGYSKYFIASWIKRYTPEEIVEMSRKDKEAAEFYRSGYTVQWISLKLGIPEGMIWKMVHNAGMSAVLRRKKAYGKWTENRDFEVIENEEVWWKKQHRDYKAKLDKEIREHADIFGVEEWAYRKWLGTQYGSWYALTVQGQQWEGEFLAAEGLGKKVKGLIGKITMKKRRSGRGKTVEASKGDGLSGRERQGQDRAEEGTSGAWAGR